VRSVNVMGTKGAYLLNGICFGVLGVGGITSLNGNVSFDGRASGGVEKEKTPRPEGRRVRAGATMCGCPT
jgi:hypothetical protein